jgi:hypothetical protein
MPIFYRYINRISINKINEYLLRIVLKKIYTSYIGTIACCIISINLCSQTSFHENGLTAVHPFYTAVTSAMHHAAEVNMLKRQQWMDATIKSLTAYQNSSMTQGITATEIETDDIYRMSYRVNGQGLIEFNDGSWVYIISNSMHNNDGVGDLTLAIDNQGNTYINEGHVCGGIIHFEIKVKTSVTSSHHFFKYFKSDTDDQGWLSLKHNSGKELTYKND